MNNLPKPLVIGVAVVAVALALFMVVRTMTKGENTDRPGKDEIIQMQKNGGAHTQTNGH